MWICERYADHELLASLKAHNSLEAGKVNRTKDDKLADGGKQKL